MRRINVVGSSGSGKTTFSRRLAKRLDCAHIEMDALFWQPDWRQSDDDTFFHKIRQATAEDRWVLDGNYSRSMPLKWQRVDTVIWLDYGFWRTFRQLMVRSVTRALSDDELWPGTGNTESFRQTFFSRESILLWMISNYRRKRRQYRQWMRSKKYQDIRFVRLTSPQQASTLLDSIGKAPRQGQQARV